MREQKYYTLGQKTLFRCNECEKRFKRKLTMKTIDVKCPHCKGYDTEPE